MKTFLLSATYIVGIGELWLAWYFWKTNSGNEIRKAMVMLCAFLGIWVLSSAAISYQDHSFWTRTAIDIIHLSGLLLLTTLVYISVIFPFPLRVFDSLHRALLFFPVIFFAYCLFFTDTVVESFAVSQSSTGIINGGELFSLYNYYLLALYLITLIIFRKRLSKLGGPTKRNVEIFFWAILLGGLPAVIIDVVLPTFFEKNYIDSLVGVAATGFWVGATSFIALRKP